MVKMSLRRSIHLRRRIGYVIQQVGLFPHMTIAENIRVTAEIAGGWSKERLAERVTSYWTWSACRLPSIVTVFRANSQGVSSSA